MNNVVNFFQRQYGNGFSASYDTVLKRLAVHERDSWKGITPSEVTADFNPTPPILAAKFAKCEGNEHILAIANEDGKIAIQDTNLSNEERGEERALDGEQCHMNVIFDIEWMPGNMKLVSASGDHTARLWTLTESQLVSSQIFNGHSRSVKTASFRRTDPAVFATGGRDGVIILWDIRAQLGSNMAPRADNCIFSGHAGGPRTPSTHRRRTRTTPKIPPHGCSSSITGLVFQDDNTLISCGAGDGVIKVWDIRRHYNGHNRDPLPKHSFPYAGTTALRGFTNLSIDSNGTRLYANCMDNHIYCYNISTYGAQPIQRYGGFKNGTFYIKSCLSPDGQYLISGSSDERSYIWNVDNPNPLLQLDGHTVEVTSVAWMQSYSDIRVVTCSDDARHKIWRIGPEHIDADHMMNYRGNTEYCEGYRREPAKVRLKSLEFTPRSVRRLVERSEKTPNTVENKSTSKRSFLEMAGCDQQDPSTSCLEIKRPNIETRGRRLFSPADTNSRSSGFAALEIASNSLSSRSLNTILEESDDKTPFNSKAPLALSDMNLRSPEPSASGTSYKPVASVLSSPTVNLPNFVIDGEAPHLVNVTSSPSNRKLKENVDWLTKIRKQKLLQTTKSVEAVVSNTSGDVSLLLSPRLQMLKTSDDSSAINQTNTQQQPSTPRRRTSQSEGHPRTPGSRRNSVNSRDQGPPGTPNMSIRRFFITITPTSETNV
ncbi:protein lethal(2)denticleless [Toxorhynchites rutilus septentrionalis]|uniref:protein lethal(2)denticleless n=1 Tax=Toxorhynchites rutilus septentrionalis TaxID=329112 RepID=UPI0024783656|nr:protein lethal(2)denticleless [Toxorhynchites rutilus septentrionalis]